MAMKVVLSTDPTRVVDVIQNRYTINGVPAVTTPFRTIVNQLNARPLYLVSANSINLKLVAIQRRPTPTEAPIYSIPPNTAVPPVTSLSPSTGQLDVWQLVFASAVPPANPRILTDQNNPILNEAVVAYSTSPRAEIDLAQIQGTQPNPRQGRERTTFETANPRLPVYVEDKASLARCGGFPGSELDPFARPFRSAPAFFVLVLIRHNGVAILVLRVPGTKVPGMPGAILLRMTVLCVAGSVILAWNCACCS
jgi:hypothetical protein